MLTEKTARYGVGGPSNDEGLSKRRDGRSYGAGGANTTSAGCQETVQLP